MDNEKVLFPSWRYHATLPACVVESQAEADALGPGWSDCSAPAPAPAADGDEPVDEPVADVKKTKKTKTSQ